MQSGKKGALKKSLDLEGFSNEKSWYHGLLRAPEKIKYSIRYYLAGPAGVNQPPEIHLKNAGPLVKLIASVLWGSQTNLPDLQERGESMRDKRDDLRTGITTCGCQKPP